METNEIITTRTHERILKNKNKYQNKYYIYMYIYIYAGPSGRAV